MTTGNGAQRKVTTIAEIRKKSRKYVTSPNTENTYLIRKAATMELMRFGMSPVVHVNLAAEQTNKPGSTPSATPQVDMKNMDMDVGKTLRHLLLACVISPELTDNVEAVDSDDKLYIGEIGNDDMWLFQEILDFSGLGAAAQKAVEEYAGKKN